MKTAQEVFNSLKEDKRIPEELKKSSKFKKCFEERYNEFLNIGVTPVVHIEGGMVILSGTRIWFDEKAIEEPFQGETLKTQYTFGMEYTTNYCEYFCERKYASGAQRYVAQNNCELSCSTELRLFYGDEEQARIRCYKIFPHKRELHAQPLYDERSMPQLSVNEIINGTLPLYLSLDQHLEQPPNKGLLGSLPEKAIDLAATRDTYLPTTSYSISYRESLIDDTYPGSNIIITNKLRTENGLKTLELTSYGSTNFKYPDSLDNISDNCWGSYNGIKNKIFVPLGYETIGDCIADKRTYRSSSVIQVK